MSTLTQRLHFLRHRIHNRLGQPEQAERALIRATTGPGAEPEWLHHLAGIRRRAHDHAGAADALARAIDGRGDVPPRWYLELGRASELSGREAQSIAAYRRWVEPRPLPDGLDDVLLERGYRQFVPRRNAVRLVRQRLPELRAAAEARQVVEDRSDNVWVYWAQGFDQAPDVVRMCRATMTRHVSRPLVELTDDVIESLVTLPEDIDAMVTNRTARSDLLRLELLARYGGTWLDATCYLRSDVGAEFAELAGPSGFFAPSKERTTIGTWHMTAQPGHYLVTMTLEALYAYWRKDGKLPHYFTFHHLFEALALTDPKFGELFAATPRVSTSPSLQLRHWMSRDAVTDEEFERALSHTSIHKLSYKAGAENTAPRSVLGRLYAAESEAGWSRVGGVGDTPLTTA